MDKKHVDEQSFIKAPLKIIRKKNAIIKHEENIKNGIDYCNKKTGYDKYISHEQYTKEKRKDRDDKNDDKRIKVLDGYEKYLRFKNMFKK